MKHEMDFAPEMTDRPLWPALARGWHMRCPNCGGGPMFDGYLSVRRNCASCGEALYHHRADDIPAYTVVLVVGKVVILALLSVELTFEPPVWVHWALWPTLATALILWLLPRVKGGTVAFQWANRMHGFDGHEEKISDF